MYQWAAAAGECFLCCWGFRAQVFSSLSCSVSLTMFIFPSFPTYSGGGGGAAAGGEAVAEVKEEEEEEEAEIGGGMDMFGGGEGDGGDY
jgi:hypothetical protein